MAVLDANGNVLENDPPIFSTIDEARAALDAALSCLEAYETDVAAAASKLAAAKEQVEKLQIERHGLLVKQAADEDVNEQLAQNRKELNEARDTYSDVETVAGLRQPKDEAALIVLKGAVSDTYNGLKRIIEIERRARYDEAVNAFKTAVDGTWNNVMCYARRGAVHLWAELQPETKSQLPEALKMPQIRRDCVITWGDRAKRFDNPKHEFSGGLVTESNAAAGVAYTEVVARL